MKKDIVFISKVILFILVMSFFYIPFVFLYIKYGNIELAITSLLCIFLFIVLPAKQKIYEMEESVEQYIEKNFSPSTIKYTRQLLEIIISLTVFFWLPIQEILRQ